VTALLKKIFTELVAQTKFVRKIHPAILGVLSGLLLFAAWPVSPFTFLIFIAFIPLFRLQEQQVSRRAFFLWTYLAMLVWNVCTTWWIMNSTVPGGMMAMLANSLLMCIPWLAFYNIRKRTGSSFAYAAFIICWLTFEYIHLNWELSWPWLTLGNVFATSPGWVQWYEFTGTSGGSLWVLLVNVLLFLIWQKYRQRKQFHVRLTSFLIASLLLPVMISLYVQNQRSIFNGRAGENVVVVQPNVDPYKKFQQGQEHAQLEQLISLSEAAIDSNTRLVVWPETAIPIGIDEAAGFCHDQTPSANAFAYRHRRVQVFYRSR
jgi:apolipoprotein N-acyltransferase